MRVGGVDIVRYGKSVFREFQDDDVPGLAAELTYRFFLALFPFMIFLAALGALIAKALNVENPAKEFIDLFGDSLPDDAASVMETQVRNVVEARSVTLLSVGILGAMWAATGGAGAIIKGLNRTYDVPDTRPLWKQKLLAFTLMLSASLAILLSLSAFFLTQVYGHQIADEIGLGGAFEAVVRWGTIPLVIVVLLLGTAVVYWAAPNIGLPFRWVTPGAVFFVAGWILATIGLSFYVANFGSYNATYGALGGVVVLLLWFYITNIILLVGAELNAVLDTEKNGPVLEERRQKAIEALQKKRQQQPETPEGAAAAHAGAGFSAAEGGARPGAPQEQQPVRERTPGLAGSVMTMVGVAITAAAIGRYVRS